MNLTIYLTCAIGALVFCVLVNVLWRHPTRTCLRCGSQTPIQNRRCKYCGYNSLWVRM